MDLLNKLRNNSEAIFCEKKSRHRLCPGIMFFPGKSNDRIYISRVFPLFELSIFSNNKKQQRNKIISFFKCIPRPTESRLNENQITTEKLFILRSISIFQSPVRAYPLTRENFSFHFHFTPFQRPYPTPRIYILIYVREKNEKEERERDSFLRRWKRKNIYTHTYISRSIDIS